jgi:hypothetical protein
MNKIDLKNLVKQYFGLVEKFETVTLEDGSTLTNGVDAELAVGDAVTKVDAEGNAVEVPAEIALPDGREVSTESGVITEIEKQEAPAEDAPVEEAMASLNVEEIISAIAEMVNGKFTSLEVRMKATETKVEAFGKAPAATKTVTSKFSAPTEEVTDKRYALALKQIKK